MSDNQVELSESSLKLISDLIDRKINTGLKERVERELNSRDKPVTTPEANPASTPEMKALMDRLAAQEKRNEALEQQNKERQTKEWQTNLTETMRRELASNGVVHVEQAIAYHKGMGTAYVDVDGTPRFKVNGVDLSVADGSRTWVRGDDAKLYLAPKGTGGSGSQQNQQNPRQPVNQPTSDSQMPENIRGTMASATWADPEFDNAILKALGKA